MDRPGRLVLLGHPVGHSLSPAMQNAALRSAGIPLEYVALDVPPDRLGPTLEGLVAEHAAGNVTIPHKEAVAARATRTPLADRAGAVNTFWVEGGRLCGDNTDVGGFDAAIRELLGAPPTGTVVLLGAGGAAAAVLAAIERWPRARAVVHARTPARAEALRARFGGEARVVGRDDATGERPAGSAAAAGASSHPSSLDEALAEATMIVNATPIGLAGNEYPIALDRLPRGAAVVDLVYRRGGTAWASGAAARGHPACDGRAMLVEQGALAFERWFGIGADRAAMRREVW
jgi:shikimate dehydrogenase